MGWYERGGRSGARDSPPEEGVERPSGAAQPHSMPALTGRELEVLKLLARGLSNKEIARELCITVHTVKAHVTRILHKLGAESRTQAAVDWARRGLSDGE